MRVKCGGFFMKKLKSKFLTSTLLFSITALTAASACNNVADKEEATYENVHSATNTPAMQKKKNPVEFYLDFDERNNYSINPDYSGRGTIINRPLDSIACKDPSSAPYEWDSKLSIPVFYGKYDESNWFNWTFDSSPWSDWSPSNKRTNYASNIYRGDSALEYQVEERKEYRYCHDVQKAKYKTRYVTWFRGSKWWNCLITYFVTDDHRYQSAPANFYVSNRYTTSVYDGTYTQTEYDYTWRTSPIGLGFFGAGYRSWDSRTAYRFRHRTVKWNERGYSGREDIPLYYSLYNRDGSNIKNGIMLESDTDLSGAYRSSDDSIKSDHYKTKCFYIPTSLISEKIIYDILLNHTDSDQISTAAYAIISSGSGVGLSAMFKMLAKIFKKSAIIKSLGNISPAFAIASLLLNIANYQAQKNKKLEIDKFANILEHIDDYNLLSVSYSCKTPPGVMFVSMIPEHSLSTNLVDKKNTSSDDIKYISMDFFKNRAADGENFIPYLQFDDCESYYGRISYMDDFSNLYDACQRFFQSFDIYDFATWFK